MRHQRDARGEEARILLGARDLAAELRAELAEHRRDVDAHLLEHAAAHERHRAAAAILAVGPGLALPRLALEAAGRAARDGCPQARPRCCSNSAQMRSRRASNQARASSLRRVTVASSGSGVGVSVGERIESRGLAKGLAQYHRQTAGFDALSD